MKRIALAVLVVVAGHSVAAADHDVEGYFGIGFGSTGFGGDLGTQFDGEGGGKFRVGFRVDRLGVDFVYAAHSVSTKLDVQSPFSMMYRSALTLYAINAHPFQLLGRIGIGLGGIAGTRTTVVSCAPPEECATKLVEEDIMYSGVSLDAGLVAQIHLRRRHQNRPVLWADFGGSLTRHRIEDITTSGRTIELVIGIACAID